MVCNLQRVVGEVAVEEALAQAWVVVDDNLLGVAQAWVVVEAREHYLVVQRELE